MTTVHETTYPVLPAEPSGTELKAAFMPTTAEIRFARRQFRQESTAVLILVQLKLLQRLGYFPILSEVPPAIIDHICAALLARPLPRATIKRYDQSGTRTRHQKLLRTHLNIQPFDGSQAQWLAELAANEAQTKIEVPDLVNGLIEELVRLRYELPPLVTVQHIATQARNEVNETIYRSITDALDTSLVARIDALLVVKAGKSGWDDLKREPTCCKRCRMKASLTSRASSVCAKFSAAMMLMHWLAATNTSPVTAISICHLCWCRIASSGRRCSSAWTCYCCNKAPKTGRC